MSNYVMLLAIAGVPSWPGIERDTSAVAITRVSDACCSCLVSMGLCHWVNDETAVATV